MQQSSARGSLYFAAPLFSDSERSFNRHLAEGIAEWFDVYLPQRDGGLLTDLVARGVNVGSAYRCIFERDLRAIMDCDVCLIILDGRSVDEGAAFELGMCFSMGKPCYGYQSDSRRLLPLGNNPMIQCALRRVFVNVDELFDWAAQSYRRDDRETVARNIA